jgi:hypothetical protein
MAWRSGVEPEVTIFSTSFRFASDAMTVVMPQS